MLQSRYEKAYNYFLELFATSFNNYADETLTAPITREVAIVSSNALYLCMSGHDCQWLDAQLMPPYEAEEHLYYTVVKCKNIFSVKGYRTTKILKIILPKTEKDSIIWWDVKKEKPLGPKYTVIAWYKLPRGLAEYID